MRSKRAFLNLLTNLLREGVSVVCGFILPYIFITSFGSEVYGLTESIATFLGFIVLLEAGFGPVVKVALYKVLAKKDTNQIERVLKTSERFFRRIAFCFLLYVLVLAVLYPMISGSNFDYAFTVALVLIMAISTFTEYFFGITYRLLLQADQKAYVTNIIQIVATVLSLCLVVIAVKCGASVIVVKIITGIVYVLKPVLQNLYVKRKYKISLSNSRADYKIEQKWDAMMHHIAFMVHSKADVVILTIMSSLNNVAIYSVYALVLNGVKSIVNVVADSFSAAFGDMIARAESETLRKRFGSYETMFMTISTIVYSCTLMLIVPFVSVYTHGVSDVDYVQPLFGVLLTLSVYLLTIRQPYNELIKAAGHFKQTRRGASVEAIINIVLSIILVWRFGLIGVAIGTLIAMAIRTTEFIYHSNKHILRRSGTVNIRKALVMVFETVAIVLASQLIPVAEMNSYFDWVLCAAGVFGVALIVVLPVNYLLFRDDFKDLWKTLKKVLNRKNKE